MTCHPGRPVAETDLRDGSRQLLTGDAQQSMERFAQWAVLAAYLSCAAFADDAEPYPYEDDDVPYDLSLMVPVDVADLDAGGRSRCPSGCCS